MAASGPFGTRRVELEKSRELCRVYCVDRRYTLQSIPLQIPRPPPESPELQTKLRCARGLPEEPPPLGVFIRQAASADGGGADWPSRRLGGMGAKAANGDLGASSSGSQRPLKIEGGLLALFFLLRSAEKDFLLSSIPNLPLP